LSLRLELAHYLYRNFVVFGGAEDRSEPGHSAVYHLDAHARICTSFMGPLKTKAILALFRLFAFGKTYGLDNLFGIQRCHAGVQRFAEIRKPQVL